MKAPLNSSHVAPELLNCALALSLQWGPESKIPFGERLLAARPQLSPAQVQTLQAWCDEVKRFAFAEIEPWFALEAEDKADQALQTTRQRYPQIDQENLSRLFNQGMYYAWHG